MPYAWKDGSDSLYGGPPPLEPVDSERFLVRYIPKLEDLPPRKCIKYDPDHQYPDMPKFKWFDSLNQEVPQPDGPVQAAASESERGCTEGNGSGSV